MAGQIPFFPVGSNCKLKVNGVTLAYATDFSYRISVPHAEPQVLGMYEASSLDPLSYRVSGSFTVIRYLQGTKGSATAAGATVPHGVSDNGNGIGYWTSIGGSNILGGLLSGLTQNDGQANKDLDPSQFQNAAWFDIEFYQKVVGNSSGIAKLRSCRITDAATAVSRRNVMTQTFQFKAIYADEDSFLANASGDGQQNT